MDSPATPNLTGTRAAGARHALFPGTFDPPTNGHLDLVRRGRAIFDELTVAVAAHHDKRHLFSLEERLELLTEALREAELTDVRVSSLAGLTVRGCADLGASVILRGVRGTSDLEYESAMLQTNRVLAPGIETVLLVPGPEVGHISSSLARQVAELGGDVSALVPPVVARALAARRGEGA
ncbi:MAG: pantetheine-phosphate adenylyltransferase [Planctomycetota bacterium]|jgi:pantetheine-phosphate adenylyltransferase|nr:pantetheine-phosphate adenylyltransferase [Planctomycetota bacterium]MDP6839987.1 pantetheine-phosphate adenylyltransferase [Planctomycetota bacterium]